MEQFYARQYAEEVAKGAAEKAIKDATDAARKLFENGVSYDVVRVSIATLSDEELQAIYTGVNTRELRSDRGGYECQTVKPV